MPLILTHASFEAKIEGPFGVDVARVSVHRSGLDRYSASAYVPCNNADNVCCDSSLNRNFESWEEALMQAAKTAVFEVNNTNARFSGAWEQSSSCFKEVNEDGEDVMVKSEGGYEHVKTVDNEEVDIVLPTREGRVMPSKVLLKEGGLEGLKRFQDKRERGVYTDP